MKKLPAWKWAFLALYVVLVLFGLWAWKADDHRLRTISLWAILLFNLVMLVVNLYTQPKKELHPKKEPDPKTDKITAFVFTGLAVVAFLFRQWWLGAASLVAGLVFWELWIYRTGR